MTDELTAAHAEIARLRAKYEPEQLDPVEVLVASYAGFPSTEFVTAGQVDRMRNALGANGWIQLRVVTEAGIEAEAKRYTVEHSRLIYENGIRRGIALARGEA